MTGLKLNNMTDKEILDYELVPGTPLSELGTMTFLGWVAGKINNQEQNKMEVVELASMIASPPMGKLSEGSKIDIMRKIEKLGLI